MTSIRTILLSRNLAESTIKTYLNSLKNLNKVVNINDNVSRLTTKQPQIIKYISTIKNKEGQKKILKPILNVLRDNDKYKTTYDTYLKLIKKIQLKIEKKVGQNKFTKTESSNKIEWKDITSIKPITLTDKIFKSMLVNDNLFLRLEYFNIKLKNYTDDDNYIKNGYLYMNSFKNIKKLGSQKFKLKKKTMDLVEQVGEIDYLFYNHNMSQPNKTRWVKNYFKRHTGKSVNNNLLRKIYVNHKLKRRLSNNVIKLYAGKMLTSIEMWNTFYKKIN